MTSRRTLRKFPLRVEAVEARIAPSSIAHPPGGGPAAQTDHQQANATVEFTSDTGNYTGPAQVHLNPVGFVSGKFDAVSRDELPPSGSRGLIHITMTDGSGDYWADVRTTPGGTFQGAVVPAPTSPV